MTSFMCTLLKHTAFAATVPMSFPGAHTYVRHISSPLDRNHKCVISFHISLYITQFEADGF
jgi:hypothetical protein